jgi:hypothetical protein
MNRVKRPQAANHRSKGFVPLSRRSIIALSVGTGAEHPVEIPSFLFLHGALPEVCLGETLAAVNIGFAVLGTLLPARCVIFALLRGVLGSARGRILAGAAKAGNGGREQCERDEVGAQWIKSPSGASNVARLFWPFGDGKRAPLSRRA